MLKKQHNDKQNFKVKNKFLLLKIEFKMPWCQTTISRRTFA